MTISKIKVGNSTHDITLPGLNVEVNKLNYMADVTSNVQNQLNGKMNDYSLSVYNGAAGNPRAVRFATINYSTCNSEAGVMVRVGMVSGHGNGISYTFLQDAIISVSNTGSVAVDVFKYYGQETPEYDGQIRQYGDIFWTIDKDTKIVELYCLMGQWATVNLTPPKRLNASSAGVIIMPSHANYSNGEKSWANNSDIALMSDLLNYYTKEEADEIIRNAISALVGSAPSTLDTLEELAAALKNDATIVDVLNRSIANKADKATTLSGYGITDAYTKNDTYSKIDVDGIVQNYLPKTGGTITGNLGVTGKITQGTTSGDTTISSMNRFQSDFYVQGDGSAPNNPRVAGFYLGKSTTDDNRHMDIVSGGNYSYIDFNQANAEVDYNVRLIANVESGFTEFQWGGYGKDKILNVAGTLQQAGKPVATQEWAIGKVDTKVSKTGDTMTGNFLIEKSNPYVGFKDTDYSTMWYMQAYQDQFGFGPSWTNAVKSDKNGNMTVPGTVKVGNAVTLQYNSSNACLDFIF